jgi:hypothetical protein
VPQLDSQHVIFGPRLAVNDHDRLLRRSRLAAGVPSVVNRIHALCIASARC